MIIASESKKETTEYESPIGKCPMCGHEAELIRNSGVLSNEGIKFTYCCSNEFGRHIISEKGNHYYFKKFTSYRPWDDDNK